MGAVALVVIVVALAPLVLDRAPKSSTQSIDVQMPAAGDKPGDAAPAPGTENAGAGQAADAQSGAGQQSAAEPAAASALAATGAAPGPAVDARAPAADASVAPTPASNQSAMPVAPAPNEGAGATVAPEHPAPAAEQTHASADGYAVPIIATVSSDKARTLKQKLQKAKLPVYLEKTPDGGKTRVRVGPFKQRDAAERARQRLVKLGFDPGKVVPKGE